MGNEITSLREFGRQVLERRFGQLEEVRGQGIQRGTRFRFKQNGKTVSCAIKAAAHGAGRIHFSYQNGSWDTLSEVDRVLYVRRSPVRPEQVEAQFHDQKTLLDAFNANRRAAEAQGFTNLPAWLSADSEGRKRHVGSGFGNSAIWRESSGAGDSEPDSTLTDPKPIISGPNQTFAVAVAKAKSSLAVDLGISTNRIEIVIRS